MAKTRHNEYQHNILTYMNEIGRGNVSNAVLLSGYGEITTTGDVADQLIWPVEGISDPPVHATGVQMSVVSSSANDTAAGTGIRILEVHYIDGNGDQQVEQVTMNGTSAVTTTATDIRFIQCAHMLTYGSLKEAAGNITISNGGTTYSYIVAGSRRCSSSARMVPRGKRAFIQAIWGGSASGSSATAAVIRLAASYLDNHIYTDGTLIPFASIAVQDSASSLSMLTLVPFPELSIIAFQCTADKSATINAGFLGYLEDA